jgi:aromatic ring hydroxylase
MNMIKNGRDYVETLRDRRAVYLDGGKVEDVTTDPAYRRACNRSDVSTIFRRRPKTGS